MRVHKTAFRVSGTLVGQEEVSSKTGQKEEASKLGSVVHADLRTKRLPFRYQRNKETPKSEVTGEESKTAKADG